jgi:hypothetical protein
MAIDIHMFVEHKVGDVWERVPDEKGPKDPHYQEELDEETKKYFDRNSWTPARHYALFGLLAGVKSKMVDPIKQPVGLPTDLSKEVSELFDSKIHYGETYYSLDELIALQNNILTISYFLNVVQFKDYIKSGKVLDPEKPNAYFPTAPGGSKLVSNEKMGRIMNMASFFDENEYITRVDQEVPYKKLSKFFWETVIATMVQITDDPTKVRCVIWFD